MSKPQVPTQSSNQREVDIEKLVLARIMSASDNLRVAIGSTEYNKEELIENVKAKNEIGKEIIEMQMDYLRDMANGLVYESIDE